MSFEEISNSPFYGKLKYHTGHEDSVIGVLSFGDIVCVVHDEERLLEKMAKDFENDYKENGQVLEEDETFEGMAREYFDYNTAGNYVGKDTPGFATILVEHF